MKNIFHLRDERILLLSFDLFFLFLGISYWFDLVDDSNSKFIIIIKNFLTILFSLGFYWITGQYKNITKYTNSNGKIFLQKEFKIKTTVTSSQIREGFSNPETVSLWNLYSFIRMFEKAGFSTNKHRLHLYRSYHPWHLN